MVRFEGHQDEVTSVAFSPDGTPLVTGSNDSTALVWDVLPILEKAGKQPATELAAAEVESHWAALAGEDAGKAFAAIRALATAPKQALPFLKDHLKPAAVPDAGQVAKWVAALDSEEFVARQKAAEQLRQLGATAVPACRKALKHSPSAEMRQRLEELLARVESRDLTAEELRCVRAAEALEWIGTPEARRLLEAVAQGLPEAAATQEAKASLDRLGKRK